MIGPEIPTLLVCISVFAFVSSKKFLAPTAEF
jgi:hypothetical protein